MGDCRAFNDFCAEHGDDVAADVMDRLAEAAWSGSCDGVKVLDRHHHNVVNVTMTAKITVADKEYGAIVDCGDWNGTVIREWGDHEEVGYYQPPKPTIYTFIPNKWLPDGLFKLYQRWTKEDWFKEKVHAYNYDKHFAPGGKTENHYRDWAKSKGLEIVTEESQADYIKRGPMTKEEQEFRRQAVEILEAVKGE